jgi:hypothetical protein
VQQSHRTVTVVGLSGATAVNVSSVGNTANINDTNILGGMTAIYNQAVGLRSDNYWWVCSNQTSLIQVRKKF